MSNSPVPRYWFPQTESIGLDEAGFLLDPEHEYLGRNNSSAAQLSALRDIACLILLGEAGLGKSTALRAEQQAVPATQSGPILVDLGELGSDEALVPGVCLLAPPGKGDSLAGRSPPVPGTPSMSAESSLPNVARVLLRELRLIGQAEGRKLRIACRSGAWPRVLEEGLKEFWPGAVASVSTSRPCGGMDAGNYRGRRRDSGLSRLCRRRSSRPMRPPRECALDAHLLTRPLPPRQTPYRRGGRDVYEQGCLELCH